MEMHVRKRLDSIDPATGLQKIKESKTECMFIPPCGHFKRAARITNQAVNDDAVLDFDVESESDEHRKLRYAREDELYNSDPETANFDVIEGFVSYTKHFKYLGSMISYSLRDDLDIQRRIDAAGKAMGALNGFFKRPQVNIYTKQLIFMAIAINFLLWGCETWALRKDLLLRLERFLTRQIRRIVGTNMYLVQKYKITLDKMRRRFNNMPSVRVLIDVRTTQFLGNILRSRAKFPARLLLISFIPSSYVPHNAQAETGFRPRTRPVGRPLKCNRESMWESLKNCFEPISEIHIDRVGLMKDFYFDALDKSFWKKSSLTEETQRTQFQ